MNGEIMGKPKKTDRNQNEARQLPGAKTPVNLRMDAELLERIDAAARRRGATRQSLLREAIDFYVWMMDGGFAVQHFTPWVNPKYQEQEGVVDCPPATPPLRRQPSPTAEVDDEAVALVKGTSGPPGNSVASSEVDKGFFGSKLDSA